MCFKAKLYGSSSINLLEFFLCFLLKTSHKFNIAKFNCSAVVMFLSLFLPRITFEAIVDSTAFAVVSFSIGRSAEALQFTIAMDEVHGKRINEEIRTAIAVQLIY